MCSIADVRSHVEGADKYISLRALRDKSACSLTFWEKQVLGLGSKRSAVGSSSSVANSGDQRYFAITVVLELVGQPVIRKSLEILA